jgi:hypothetical protein
VSLSSILYIYVYTICIYSLGVRTPQLTGWLGQVQLGDVIRNVGGLSANVSEDGGNFSQVHPPPPSRSRARPVLAAMPR